jgi:FKBP-type peptidyl-prolyl cis-trans isomerase FkpA
MAAAAVLASTALVATPSFAASTETLPSGVIVQHITEGTGAKPTASDVVKVNYRGTLANGTEFDSSAKHGGPATFPLGRVIPCWTQGVQPPTAIVVSARFRRTATSRSKSSCWLSGSNFADAG